MGAAVVAGAPAAALSGGLTFLAGAIYTLAVTSTALFKASTGDEESFIMKDLDSSKQENIADKRNFINKHFLHSVSAEEITYQDDDDYEID